MPMPEAGRPPTAALPPAPPAPPRPPVAERRPVVHELHGDRRVDEWAWLRDRDDPAVIAHLEAENAHTEAATAHLAPLRERLVGEIVGRIQETDSGAPVPHGPFEYFWRTVEGRQYRALWRRARRSGDDGPGDGPGAGPGDGRDEVILDQNALAEGHDYFRIGDAEVSPDHRLLAYTVDCDGSEVYAVAIRDLESGEDLPDRVERASYGLAWASDSLTLFGTRPDAAMRPHQVWRRRVGGADGSEEIVHEEADERFFAGVARTRSGGLIVIHLGSHVTSEVRILDAGDPDGDFRIVEPRRQGIEYAVDHHGDRLLIVTNDGAPNFRLMSAPLRSPGRGDWTPLLAHDDAVKLDGVDAFAGHIALWERAGGMRRIRLVDVDERGALAGDPRAVDQPEEVCTAAPGDNREWATDVLRFEYSSLVTPTSVVDLDVHTGRRTVVKVEPVLGGYDLSSYVSERLWATAADGVAVPLSVLRRRDVRLDGSAPALLYGYGAYETSIDPTFRSTRLSLVDRGCVFAIAHVRGGGELGRPWYEAGRLAAKTTSFTDFVAAADRLVEAGYTSPDRLAFRGGSAGGLLMGAVLNLRPDLPRAVVAEVPFVDVVTTMLDESLPLTVIEWEEWGDPRDPEQYGWMRAYSPYDNVAPAAHPAVLATGGLNDPRVGFWEPAKWVQRLRALDRGGGPILLRMQMGAGHGGRSGRYDAWRDEAFVQAFLIDCLRGWREPGSGR